MPYLKLRLFGPPQVELDGMVVTLSTRKAMALLAYLAVSGRSCSRDALAALLWPESNSSRARGSLRKALSALNSEVGGEWLAFTGDTVTFQQSPHVLLDVAQFNNHLATYRAHAHRTGALCTECTSALAAAVSLYSDDFLAGFSLPDSPDFDEWQRLQEERLRMELASALEQLVEYHAGSHAWEEAVRYGQRWVALDPLDEVAQRRLMQLFAWAGRRTAALRQYDTLLRVLQQELGAPPAAETLRLYHAIKAGELHAPDAVSPQPASPQRATLGILHAATLTAAAEPAAVEKSVLVAREPELARLDSALALALAGEGQIVFITGEPGSGKTALLQSFVQQAVSAHRTLVVAGTICNAYTGVGDPFLAFRDLLNQLTGASATDTLGILSLPVYSERRQSAPLLAVQALIQGGPALLDTFIPALPLVTLLENALPEKQDLRQQLQAWVERNSHGSRAPMADQQQILYQYTQVMALLAAEHPLLLIIDDLQWADATSIVLLFHLARHTRQNRILLLAAFRPHDLAMGRSGERHPLQPVLHELQRYFGDIQIDLDQALESTGRTFVDQLLDSNPNRLGEEFRAALYRLTEGHPLFTVELLQSLQARGDLVQELDGYWIERVQPDWDLLPARIEGIIAERIDRLSELLQEILAIASIAGERFNAETIAQVQGADVGPIIRRLSDELGRRHHLVYALDPAPLQGQRLAQYRFRHSLFQYYLYNRLDPNERRYLHGEVGSALEKLYGAQADEFAVELARHFAEAGQGAKMVNYLLLAAEQALQLYAYAEAVAHCEQALAWLHSQPDTPARARLELPFQLLVGAALDGSVGTESPAMADAYVQALQLYQQSGEPAELRPQHIAALLGLALHHAICARWPTVRELCDRAFALASQEESDLLTIAHWCTGMAMFNQCEFTSARYHLEEGITLSHSHHGRYGNLLANLFSSDPEVACRTWLCWTYWVLGLLDQALEQNQAALARARAIHHPPTLLYALCETMGFHCFRREPHRIFPLAEEAYALPNQYTQPFLLSGVMALHGWALTYIGNYSEGCAKIYQELAYQKTTGAQVAHAYSMVLLVEGLYAAGEIEEGLQWVEQALEIIETGTEGYLEAEIYRWKGELLLAQPGAAADAAEAAFLQALVVARRQQAKIWELRAAVSLGRLWQRQGKRTQAHQLLDEIYGWFTGGFDTLDLQEAKALLAALA
jgi:DNA-binding SARP family transcriptional activator/predicted ATPase